jgi:D-alanyl-D-alanine dipeptidase
MLPGLTLALAVAAAPAADPLVDVEGLHPSFGFDLRYATPDNFAGRQVYAEARCLLRASVAARMVKAQRWLDRHAPGHRLLFKDCYRPHSAQRILWDAVKGTPKAAYVANPGSTTGSIHSYGAAVDVTLADAAGEVDMGTPYDHLGKLAEPRHDAAHVAAGQLTPTHVERRRLLRRAMVEGGAMRSIPNEWWHFDAGTKAEVRARFERLDVPFDAVPRGGGRAPPR